MFDGADQFRTNNRLPDRASLMHYAPEDSAKLIVRFFGAYERGFIPAEVLGSISDRAYGRDEEVERILMEGVSYLERYGLLVEDIHTYSGTGRGRRLSRQGQEFARSPDILEQFVSQVKDPRALLHPEIVAKALPHFERGGQHIETAVFSAFKAVEVAVRKASGLSDSDIGVPLMNRAFGPGGSLRDDTADRGEEEGIRNLFGGAIAVYKNPSSHRQVVLHDEKRALNALILASELLSIVDRRAPDTSKPSPV